MNIIDNLRIVERGDPLTQQEWRAMTESRTFQLLMSRLDYMILQEVSTIEKVDDVDTWRRAQGAVKALRVARQLPEIIDGELEHTSLNTQLKGKKK